MAHPVRTPERSSSDARRGLLAAVGAFLIWGALPLYLRPLRAISPLTIMSHRLLWCCLFVSGWLALRGELGRVRAALGHGVTRRRLLGSAALISVNWLVYVWAVGAGHVVDASLGYFINPLVNVLLGVTILGERLERAKWIAVALAGAGVCWLTLRTGRLPWIALALALSFGGYGLIRKVVAVDSVIGLAAETSILTPLALAWLGWQELHGPGAFGGAAPPLAAWLVAGGIVTAVPLALFAFGARRISYSAIGIVQYIGPSLQLLLGVVVFGEAFPLGRALGFALIWAGLVVYGADGLLRAARA